MSLTAILAFCILSVDLLLAVLFYRLYGEKRRRGFRKKTLRRNRRIVAMPSPVPAISVSPLTPKGLRSMPVQGQPSRSLPDVRRSAGSFQELAAYRRIAYSFAARPRVTRS